MTIHFPDVSNWQSGLSLDGAVAVIAKASQGTTYRDPTFTEFQQQADDLGIPFAGYHWVTGDDIHGQAELAISMVGPAVPMMWDAEDEGATVDRLLDITTVYRGLGGLATLVYLPRWWWSSYLGSPDLTPLADAGLALISSNYTSYSDDGPGWEPYGGVYPAIWQYTSSAYFNNYYIDFNAYRGTVDELWKLWTGGSGDDMSSDATWKFIEDGQRPIKPDTWTPDGYASMPNNWLGTQVAMAQQDAARAAQGVTDLHERLDALSSLMASREQRTRDTLDEIVARLRRATGSA